MNVSNSAEALFLTNVNKKFQSKNNSKKKLSPIGKNLNDLRLLNSNNDIHNNKQLMRSISQPKIGSLKTKLKPINFKRNSKKVLVNSKSQDVFDNIKK